ncbi:hypothetical protein [Oceanibium sediminis]|uniref:hypothetical protein n=1 Tax=Oceanibium sediminis TaxID=2026339 RepID=UPI000DD35FED|nr:hypothetical protein [Oceanibium sediminis]
MSISRPIVVILGSGPTVTRCRDWDLRDAEHIVAINNAHRVRPDWSHAIHPHDFPKERLPAKLTDRQALVTEADFVPAQNAFGGFVFGGGTMAFTAGYWALHRLHPRLIAFFGCDMVYPVDAATHFYGTGTADPLRQDISLRSLEAKSARLALVAARQGCAVVNLSPAPSRLTFPRARPTQLRDLAARGPALNPAAADTALRAEQALGYDTPDGRYWEYAERFDPAALDAVDALWRAAERNAASAPGLSRTA